MFEDVICDVQLAMAIHLFSYFFCFLIVLLVANSGQVGFDIGIGFATWLRERLDSIVQLIVTTDLFRAL
jgi:hypothetical protein